MSFKQWQERHNGYLFAINGPFLNKATDELLVYYINLTRTKRDYYYHGLASAAIMILRGRKEREVMAK
jgi:hypothetical protein